MSPLTLGSAVLFLLSLSPALGRARTVQGLRPVVAALLILPALPWLQELATHGTRAGLFAVPVLMLGSALSQGPSWPRTLVPDVLLGCASGLTALLLATGVAGTVDALWEQPVFAQPAAESLRGMVRSLAAGLALAAIFALVLAALRGEGESRRGPVPLTHGAVVAAGLTATAVGAGQVALFWAVLGIHAAAADALASARASARSAPADRLLSSGAHLSVAVVTFATLELLS